MANGSGSKDGRSEELDVNEVIQEIDTQNESGVSDTAVSENLVHQLDKIKLEAEIETEKRKQSIGLIGRVFGEKENAPTYLLCLVCVVLLGLLVYLVIYEESETIRTAILSVIASIVLSGLGYLVGGRENKM